MTNQETRRILKTCLGELGKIQEDPNHLNVNQAQDLFSAIESLENLNQDFEIIRPADIATIDQLLAK
ncbi:MAG: hypothetical protein AB4063_07650 [Crocosphaera sp.]